MSAQHEPGPWSVLNHHGVFVLAGGLTVAEVSYMLPDAKGETKRLANAALLAAAPELLSALERLTHSYRLLLARKPVRDVEETLAEVEAAIAKASHVTLG